MITKRYFYRISNYIWSGCALFLLFFSVPSLRADPQGPNLFPDGSFEDCSETYNPWAGVDGDGNIHGLDGTQFAVGDDGNLYEAAFGPSVAVGDLNGDGIPDLVLADSRGFFWYFPNSGTVKAPKFTQGQIIPIWLGDKKIDWYGAGTDNIVPRIQLIDFNDSGKLSLVVGTYQGKLFYIPNTGTTTQPNFPATVDNDHYLMSTHSKGMLWCNYLAPFLYHWFGPNLLDLVMGEGTYSANSIYLLQNTNSNISPDFSEAGLQKIIPGMGLEQLTPTVLDWNNDGKPDILAGDRTGYLNLFLNTSTDPTHPTFADATHVSVGGNEKQGGFVTVATGDLTDNKLPNLLIGSDAGTIVYATNAGKLGAPDFSGAAAPLQGVNPFPKILVPTNWVKYQPAGVPDELVTCTNPDVEPHFTFPTGETTKYALKFTLFPITDPIFKNRYYPPDETFFNEHAISCKNTTQPLKPKTRYRVHLWAKADSDVQGLYIRFWSHYATAGGHEDYGKTMDISAESDWTETDRSIEFDFPDLVDPSIPVSVEFRFRGQGTLYIDDMSIRED
jgi:hypothetical protein